MKNNEVSENKKKETVPRTRIGVALFGTLGLVVLLAGALFLTVFFFPENPIGVFLRRSIPIPIATVGSSCISYRELDENRESIRRFYESQSEEFAERGLRVDFGTPDGRNRLILREKDILNKLIEDTIIRSLAREQGIRLSDDAAEERFEASIRKEGGDRRVLEDRLMSLYGWDVESFREKVIEPSLYREALETSFERNRDITGAKKSIEEAALFLSGGGSFSEAVRMFSEGESKEKEGELGWVDIELLVPELQDVVRTQSVGSTSSVIESSLGFHILLLSERKKEGEKVSVLIRQVFVRKPSFPAWLAEKKREKYVFVLSRRYLWDRGEASVLFRDEELKSFEKKALERTEGDPSLVF